MELPAFDWNSAIIVGLGVNLLASGLASLAADWLGVRRSSWVVFLAGSLLIGSGIAWVERASLLAHADWAGWAGIVVGVLAWGVEIGRLSLRNKSPAPVPSKCSPRKRPDGESAPARQEEAGRDREKQSPRYGALVTTVFFNERMCDAFPGNRGLVSIEDPEVAVARLSELLKSPLEKDGWSPVWEMDGNGDMYISEYKVIARDIVLMGHHRYRVRKLHAYRGSSYWRDFVVLEYGAEDPTGLYPERREGVDHPETARWMRTEEYGVWNDSLITREEFDDNAVVRGGRTFRTTGARLEVRMLTAGAFVIAAQFSPLHSHSFERELFSLLQGITTGACAVAELVERADQLDKHDALED